MKLINKKHIIVFVLFSVISFSTLLILEKEIYTETPVSFKVLGNTLSGKLILPDNKKGPFPVIIFVHGDGPTTYDSDGIYPVFWKHFAEAGIASFSWNKAGIGGSTGNWLHQSQHDRAFEVIGAIEVLKKKKEICDHQIGLIGFSQGGWVLPIVSTESGYPDFMILVSGAINMVDQSAFFSKNQFKISQYTEKQIIAMNCFDKSMSEFITKKKTYKEYLQHWNKKAPGFYKENREPLTSDRFIWNQLNWHYDARDNLKDIKCPVLAVFGDKDNHVNHGESVKIYLDEFKKSGNNNFIYKIFPNATHAILKSEHFSSMNPGVLEIVKFAFLEEQSFVEGYLDFLTEWVKNQTNKDKHPAL